jgi:CubicO group peptidase (beta-lactamase class C family)
MRLSNLKIALLALFITVAGFSCSERPVQTLSLESKIDSLFSRWNNPHSPGGAVAIIKDGKIVFSKGYGMANLEYGIPNTPATVFHIASESKQYTNFCIALLEQEGKLSFDDDIRKFIPEMHDFGHTITLRHLIYHTSGLRDQWQLLALSGTRLDDVITQDHVLKLLSRQRELNFVPGTRHLYCNSGYTLLAEVVKRVSGLCLREFAQQRIFEPLGMKNTHFHDNYTEIVPGRAYSYSEPDSASFRNSILSYSTVGATSLFTTVEDEALWLQNYFDPKIGGQTLIEQMHERAILTSGDTLPYAFAVVHGLHKGWKMIGHGGSDAGFRTFAGRFPEANMGIIVFSNLGNFNPRGMVTQIADLLLDDNSQEPTKNEQTDVELSNQVYYTGRFISTEGNRISITDTTGLQAIMGGSNRQNLIPISDTEYRQAEGAFRIRFERNNPNQFMLSQQGTEILVRKLDDEKPGVDVLKAYTGTYYNSETESKYRILIKDDMLVLSHSKYKDVSLNYLLNDQFSCTNWWMSNINFNRNNKGSITGFEVNQGRVLGLKFEKLMD